MNYHDQKSRRRLTHDIRKRWTAVSTLLGHISSVYRDLHLWRSNQWPQIAMPKLYNWATVAERTSYLWRVNLIRPLWLYMVVYLHPMRMTYPILPRPFPGNSKTVKEPQSISSSKSLELDGSSKPLKLVDHFTYLSNNISSTESDVNLYTGLCWLLTT